jgi:hypothetical protein
VKTIETQLRCQDGADTGDTCFSDAQIAAIARIASPYRPGVTLAGRDAFPRWALLEGARYEGRSTFGKSPKPTNPPSESEILVYAAGAATVKYIITRKPEFDAMTFEPKDWQARLQEVAGIMDVTDVDLTPFRARGGKMILTHGGRLHLAPQHRGLLPAPSGPAGPGQYGCDDALLPHPRPQPRVWHVQRQI